MAQNSEKSMHFLARQAKYRMTGGYYGAAARRGENGRSLRQNFENKLLLDKIEAVTRQRHVLQIAATYVKAKRELSRRAQTV